jgi:hypothetical protein
MKLDTRDEAANRMLAEKAVCVCEGRNNPRPRAHRDGGDAEGWVEGDSATGVDFTGVTPITRGKSMTQQIHCVAGWLAFW